MSPGWSMQAMERGRVAQVAAGTKEESWVSALRTVGPEDASVILTVLLVPAGFYLAYLPRPPASLKLIAK
jgi:hypothetical protein